MNIVIGKFGRSISSNKKKWSAVGGDNEPFIIFDNLARMYPSINFYLIGKSDFSRNKNYNKPSNIIDLWAKFNKKAHDEERFIIDQLKDIHIDGGIIMSGPLGQINCANKGITKVKNPNELAKPLGMFIHYASPMIQFLNETNIPWLCLGPDIRFFNFSKDLLNPPKVLFTQRDGYFSYKHFQDFQHQQTLIEETMQAKYRALEKTFLVGRTSPLQYRKTEKFLVVLNEMGNGGTMKGDILNDYILKYFNDVSIIGKWSDKWMSDPRFKGPKKFEDLLKILPSVKYTFLVPLKEDWVTAKFWEMTYNGVIPFMHHLYDSQKKLNVPDFIRIKDPKDLLDKIEYLENNKDYYEKLVSTLQSEIKEEDLTGESLIYNIMTDFGSLIDKKFELPEKQIPKQNQSFFVFS